MQPHHVLSMSTRKDKLEAAQVLPQGVKVHVRLQSSSNSDKGRKGKQPSVRLQPSSNSGNGRKRQQVLAYYAEDNDTPADIARSLGLDVEALVEANRRRFVHSACTRRLGV